MISLFWVLAAYGRWLSPGSAGPVICDPIVQACFDRRTSTLTTDNGVSEVCGDTGPLFSAIETHGVAIVSLYSYADRSSAQHIDDAFARRGVAVMRRPHDGGYLRGVAAVTGENVISAVAAMSDLDLCPYGTSVVPGAIAR